VIVAPDREIAIRCRGVSMNFGAVRALRPCDLDVSPSSIHALVGQNGAGKSTLLGIMAGRIRPASGSVEVFGADQSLGDPRAARAAGVVGIYQELTTVPATTALENVFLGQWPSRHGLLSKKKMLGAFQQLCRRLGVSIDPMAICRTLSVADQQLLEIMRALQFNARIILFDEPTASLAPTERRALFRVMRDLRSSGHSMVFVSHNLGEVLDLADEISVFRDGRRIGSAPTHEWTKSKIISAMLGRDMDDIYHRRAGSKLDGNPILLRATNVTVPGILHSVDIELRREEVLGIGGLAGSGRTSLLRALAGVEPKASGSLWIDGTTRPWPRSPRMARTYGLALVPEDRKSQGLIAQMTVMENIAIGNLQRSIRHGFLSRDMLRDATVAVAERFRLDQKRLGEEVTKLSGGNQQKVLLARWWYDKPKVLMVDEPTRGIDIAAKSEVLDSLRDFANQGIGVIVVSSELEEVVSLADRVIVLAEGHRVQELPSMTAQITVAEILSAAFKLDGAHSAGSADR
jgi:rhamnose transport system ATP-binding protein